MDDTGDSPLEEIQSTYSFQREAARRAARIRLAHVRLLRAIVAPGTLKDAYAARARPSHLPMALEVISLDTPVDGTDGNGHMTRVGDLIPAEEDIEERVILHIERDLVRQGIRGFILSLLPRDRRVIARVFWDGASQEQVAHELGVTRPAVHKLLKRIYRRGRAALAHLNPDVAV